MISIKPQDAQHRIAMVSFSHLYFVVVKALIRETIFNNDNTHNQNTNLGVSYK